MPLPNLTPEEARRRIAAGARLVDIRNPDEFARSRIAGAENRPLGGDQPIAGPVVFLCRSGNRTAANADRLGHLAEGEVWCLEGGLDAWRKAGLPVEDDRSQPLEIMRQVQIAAGLLVVAGVLLGFLAAPVWFGLSAFVGAGLIFAGATGWCGMARLLALMPWNRRMVT